MTYTINANAKNVWIRDNEDTMDLSPITDASSVYLENGRTIEQELGEGSMVSNIATVDTSMTKVIDGTLDGAYESCVFKGKSLVNLVTHSKRQNVNVQNLLDSNGRLSWNTTGVWGKVGFTVQGKPNSTYCVKYGDKHTTLGIYVRYVDGLGGATQSITTLNSTCKKFTTDTTGIFTLTLEQGEATTDSWVQDFMILEYQEGMENWDIPYFTGLCDVKMPILRNVGKNLFDGELEKGNFNGGTNNIRSSTFTLEELRTYTISNDKNYSANVVFHDDNNQYISEIPISKLPYTFTTPLKTKYVWIRTWSNQDDLTVKFQIEKGSTATSYEDHKTNILHTPETVTLRSLPNGVRDELNLKTGEYIKRIGEVVFDGSETWYANDLTKTNTSQFRMELSGRKPGVENMVTNMFVTKNTYSLDEESVFGSSTANYLYVRLLKSKLTEDSLTSFKQWLSQNPITVQYELETPVTTKVVLTQSEPIVKIGTELPNGVCDTYNLLTGEHIQRVGKVVLDGSEVWKRDASSTKPTDLERFATSRPDMVDSPYNTGNLVVSPSSYHIKNNDSTPRQLPNVWNYYQANIYMDFATNAFGMTTSDTADAKITKLKSYLQSNPVTVRYELKNPIVTKKNGFPNTYGITLPSGVVDKYNESTGVYTQNVGVEYVGDNGAFDNIIQQSNGTRIHYNLGESIRPIKTKVLTDDRFTFKDTWSETHEPYSVFIGSGLDMYFVIPTSEGVTTIAQAKDWFEANKTLLYYELATPKTIDIPLINVGQVLPNGVCDTYNPITKEYVKRVSGTVLVGNEDWSLMNSPYETDCIGFVTPCSLANWTQSQANLNIVCEGYVGNYELWNVDEEGFSVFKTPTRLAIKVKRSKLSTADINGFKKFLKLNPLAVWYELATPEVSTVDLDLSTLYSSSPIAYENGHIILESGHDGQSLLPTLEYSTVTNRVKQIESIGEQVLRQEKQLTMLEQMLIQNIIGMDYNNTLLTLNLEIDEVM